MKKIFLILLSLVLITSCNSSLPTEDEEKIKIETSIIPLASITNYIGSEFVEVKSIVPA
jgi:ABC-type Zn uptake system ZnuABC Zn-binding protein ZnuA